MGRKNTQGSGGRGRASRGRGRGSARSRTERLLDDLSRPDSAIDALDPDEETRDSDGSESGEEREREGVLYLYVIVPVKADELLEPISVPVAMWVSKFLQQETESICNCEHLYPGF